ncbi:hypothetical protein A7X64_15325 [Stenotrophomonas maltophilia]|uniref:hypothetical protein n=1 Tax=Stenotrophomonas maltophilia TaxID=40324 RepID=UPI000DA96CA6|nr:hypothetical protein [Stenotrophomonas maltophilia]PZS58644.1 hypothetical protein A7X64_15325 [Stenotrophomonas maltophilia]
MSNDKTTLADVQPGGKVQVMPSDAARALLAAQYRDDGDKAKAIRINHKSLTDSDKRALRAIETALSAQLSPGGQGEVCVPLPTPGNGEWSDGWNACRDAMLRGEGEALAARQPVESEENVAADTYWTLAEMIEPHVQREGVNPDGALPASVHDSVAILLEHWLRARQPVGEPVAIPEGWALVDLAEYTVLPQIPTTAMMDAGWPIGEQITDRFDVKGAYADLIAEHDAKGEGIIHGPSQHPAQAVDLGAAIKAAFPLLTDYGLHHSHCCEYKLIDERHRLHNLIGSQAVGNG